MRTAIDDKFSRLLPIEAGEFYTLRRRIAYVADQLLQIAQGGTFSSVEAEELWLEATAAGVTLDEAWRDRKPNLRVAK